LLDHPSEYMRWWAIQLLVEDKKAAPGTLTRFLEMAKTDPSPMVRLALASALQRLPVQDRWAIAAALVAHEEDVQDQNLPLMVWYAIEPMVPTDYSRSIDLMGKSKIPIIRQFISRRISSSYMASQ
jgi:hypothetical protein